MTPPRHLVDATGTRRRINALHAAGWTGSTLGRAYPRGEVSKQRVHQWRHTRYISPENAEAWRELYDQLHGLPGPCTHSRILALRAGHKPPEYWAGVDIDDPEARPRTAADEPDEDEAA